MKALHQIAFFIFLLAFLQEVAAPALAKHKGGGSSGHSSQGNKSDKDGNDSKTDKDTKSTSAASTNSAEAAANSYLSDINDTASPKDAPATRASDKSSRGSGNGKDSDTSDSSGADETTSAEDSSETESSGNVPPNPAETSHHYPSSGPTLAHGTGTVGSGVARPGSGTQPTAAGITAPPKWVAKDGTHPDKSKSICFVQGQNPDEGQTRPLCRCTSDGSTVTARTLDLGSSAPYSLGCAYPTLPAKYQYASIDENPFGQPATNLPKCEVQSQTNQFGLGKPERLPGCVPETTTTSENYLLSLPRGSIFTSTGESTTWTATARGDPETLEKLPPQMTAMSSNGAGVDIGNKTSKDLWYSMSTAFVDACGDGPYPITQCATATISDITYAKSAYGGKETDTGNLEIDSLNVEIPDKDSLNRLAYNLGANAALSIERHRDDACKEVELVTQNVCLVAWGGCGTPKSEGKFTGCVLPGSFIIQEFDGTDSFGATASIWVSFRFVNDDGNKLDTACKIATYVADAVLAIVMVFSWLAGPAAGAAGTAIGIAGKAASAVKFGCNALDQIGSASEKLEGAEEVGEKTVEISEKLADSFSDVFDASNDGFTQGLDQIGKTFDALVGVMDG